MKKIIMAVIMSFVFGGVEAADHQQINPRVEQRLQELIDKKFSSAILMTTKECSVFGEGWKNYERIGGRFPLATGEGIDARSERQGFKVGYEGGAYQHKLTELEIPSHKHSYKDHHFNRSGRGRDMGDRHDHQHEYRIITRTTKPWGGGKDGVHQPHNNMPPYLALNFCHRP